MRAVVLRDHGGPEVLAIEEVEEPAPGPDQILVDVAHTALNRADTLQRQGGYPDPRNRDVEIPGLEYAGTVAAGTTAVETTAPGVATSGAGATDGVVPPPVPEPARVKRCIPSPWRRRRP